MEKELKKYEKYEKKEIKLISNIKEVETEEEYWKFHAIYDKKLKILSRSFKKFIYYPENYIKEFELILSEMISYGLVDLEWANSKRMDLYKQLNYPNEFKEWLKKKGKKLIGKKDIKNKIDDNLF